MPNSNFTDDVPHGFMELVKNAERRALASGKSQMFPFQKKFLTSASRPHHHRARKFTHGE